jgi:hypothetical protein
MISQSSVGSAAVFLAAVFIGCPAALASTASVWSFCEGSEEMRGVERGGEGGRDEGREEGWREAGGRDGWSE